MHQQNHVGGLWDNENLWINKLGPNMETVFENIGIVQA